MDTSLIRRIEFRASHLYALRDVSVEDNQARFGPLSQPHPHDFTVELAVTGSPERETGFVVDLVRLDEVLDRLIEPIRGTLLNTSIPDFAESPLLPSCENLARWFLANLSAALEPEATVLWVRVWEDGTLGAEARHRA